MTNDFNNVITPVLGVGVAAEAMGVKRKRCIWPLGSAACISCCPGPGMTVTPWGMTCSCPDVCPWPWTITVRVCWLPGTLVCWSTPEQTCCFCSEADKREYMHKRWKKMTITIFLSQSQLSHALCGNEAPTLTSLLCCEIDSSLTWMSWPSCARVSLTCPWPCARGVPACVCPVAVGLAAPWPLTVATGLVPGIAVETAWPRIICVTTCCPPWPGRQRCITVFARLLESVSTLMCTALTS